MGNSDQQIFVDLFREACEKCFGHSLHEPLSETESKQLSNAIFESTGLVIGVKSIKNYSQFVTGSGRQENPSTATLDTLARYVMDAPATDEITRKDREPHHPYWFGYKRTKSRGTRKKEIPKNVIRISSVLMAIVMIAVLIYYFSKRDTQDQFVDDFNSVDDASLTRGGWTIVSKDKNWWSRKAEKEGHLTLYTLTGDNWSDSSHAANITNLLIREIDAPCFSTEVHFSNFVPAHNWQQAGILLMEDTLLTSKGIRLSLAYNDFFGGYNQAPEIIIQAISSLDVGGFRKPEEFAHVVVTKVNRSEEELVKNNLSKSALRIEKLGTTFRFLYSTGSLENAAFKEVAVRDFKISPRYIAIFAIQGFVANSDIDPVYVNKFTSSPIDCH